MNIRLFKKRQMNRMYNWMVMTGHGSNAIDPYFMSVKQIESICNHENEVWKRNEFCRKRKLGNVSYERMEHADRLKNYINKRYERRQHADERHKRNSN